MVLEFFGTPRTEEQGVFTFLLVTNGCVTASSQTTEEVATSKMRPGKALSCC
jgi:hypothetical protein